MKNFKLLKSYWPVLIVILIGSYWRLAGIVAGTFGFTHDQGRDLLAAWAIVHGKLTLIGPTTGLAGVFHGPLWYWLLALLSFLGSGDPKFILSAIVFLYLVVELWLFWVIKRFYGPWPAIVSVGLISLSPFFIAINGQLWSPSMVTLSMMVAIIALIAIANGKKWFPLLGLALGANIQFEAAGGFFLLIAVILTLIFIAPPKIKLFDWLLLLGGFLATLIPQALFEARHGFLMTNNLLGYLNESRVDFIAEYGVKSVEYKTGLFFDNFHKLLSSRSIVPTLFLILVLFVLTLRLLGEKNGLIGQTKLVLIWSFSIIFFFWILVNLYFDVVWHHFLLGISVLYIMIITFLLYNFQKYFPKINFLLTAVIFLIMVIPNIKNFNSQNQIIGDHSFYRNQLAIIDEVYADAEGKSFNVVVYDPTTFSYTYDYLFSWYGAKKYGKRPVDNLEPAQLVYYIIEPDDIEGRREKWIRERDGDGRILWSREFWSDNGVDGDGLLVQRRLRTHL